MTTPLCALVIGHNHKQQGASNRNGLTEFAFNEALSMDILAATKKCNVMRVYRHNYKQLPAEINKINPDFIISLHCNAFNTQAHGTETLYLMNSWKGHQLAQVVQTHLVRALKLSDRGVKATAAEDRGGYLLQQTRAPCVIAEPFFIDNDADLSIAQTRIDNLVRAYVNSIEQYAYLLKQRS